MSTFRFRRTALCDEIAPKISVFNTYTKVTLPECRSSGKPVKQWCIENKIKGTTYYRWEREILGTAGKNRNKPERSGTAVFAELPAPIKQYRQVSEQSATLHIGNVSIDIYSGMDAELLKTLLEAVRLC